MGTLTSCSFGTVSLKRGSSWPVSNAFNLWRKTTTTTTMKPKSLCLLCRKREQVSYRTAGRFRCSGSNDGRDGVGEDGANLSNDSNVTATAVQPEEAAEERRSRNELDSEESPASVSSRQRGMGVDSGSNDFQEDISELMPLLGPERVDPADVKLIKDKLFGYSTFWVRDEEPYGYFDEGILFLGNLRGNREEVFAKLQRLLVEVTGDKYNLFMLEERDAEELDPRGGPRVSFALLRKEASEPGPTTLWQYVIAFLLFILTAGSSVRLGIASQMNRLPPEVVKYFTDPDAIAPPDVELLLPYVDSALPLAFGVLGILIFHEVGHFVAAYSKKVKLSIPFFIPNITLGSFGAITQFKSILPDRSTKVDISLAGPFAGAVLSSSMFAVGLLLSSNPDAVESLVQVPSVLFQDSLLLGLISRAALGYSAMHTAMVSIHPLAIAGWCGLTMTAFNLLPVGCLDGGRAMQGAFGRGAVLVSGLITYSMLGFGLLGGPLSRPWGLFVVIWQRSPEKPCFDDVAEVGKWRKGAVVMATLLVLLTLLPVWDELAEELGIGLVSTF